MTQPTDARRAREAEDPRIRRSWLVFAGTFVLLGVIAVLRLSTERARPIDWAIIGMIVAVGFAAIRNRLAVQALEASRRAEAESFARILQGLSRSISADAVVGAIVEELGIATGADHVVIVRRRPDARVLEAILVNVRSGGSTSSTLFPVSDLEDLPDPRPDPARGPIAIPIEVAGPLGTIGAGKAIAAMAPGGIASSVPPDAVRIALAAAARGPDRRVRGRRLSDADEQGLYRSGAPTIAAADPSNAEPSPVGRSGRLRQLDPDVVVAERIAARARSDFGLRHTLVAPLTVDGRMVGALLISRRTAGEWPAAAQRLLSGAAVESSAALSRAYSHRQAEAAASTDPLTGLPNRRYFDEFCALLARRRRAEDAVGVLMIDIDRFKALNDTHGHGVGDEVLKAVAGAIVTAVREDDVPARHGGEEFVVLLRNPTKDVAIEVGERVREAVAGLDLGRFGVPGVSVSVGVAVADAPGATMGDVVDLADRALYAAKRAGRDRVVAA